MEKLEKFGRVRYLYTSGLTAISLLILQGFIGIGQLDPAGIIAILCFAIAIPSLAGTTVIGFLAENEEYDPKDKTYKQIDRIASLGMTTALIGTGATFWHILPIAGIIFSIVSFLVSGTVARVFMNGVRNVLKDRPDIAHSLQEIENAGNNKKAP